MSSKTIEQYSEDSDAVCFI